MKRLSGLSMLTIALVASACSAEGPPPILEFSEADDRLLDYPFAPEVTGLVEVDSTEISGEVRVRVADSRDHLVVSGQLTVLDVPDTGMMFIHLEAAQAPEAPEAPEAPAEEPEEPETDPANPEEPTIDEEALESDDMRFVLLTENEEGAWAPIVVAGEYEIDGIPTVSQLISFDMIVYSPEHKQMMGYHGSIGREFTGAMDVPTTGRIGVFALPEVTADGELVGAHQYTMQALCGEAACVDPVEQGPRADVNIINSEDLGAADSLSR